MSFDSLVGSPGAGRSGAGVPYDALDMHDTIGSPTDASAKKARNAEQEVRSEKGTGAWVQSVSFRPARRTIIPIGRRPRLGRNRGSF